MLGRENCATRPHRRCHLHDTTPATARAMRLPLPLIACLGMLLAALIAVLYVQPLQGLDAPGCTVPYMNPGYLRVVAFDTSHTAYARKYLLYLYREEDVDPVPPQHDEGFAMLDGVPLLFIPGNAGLFRQVRSLAAKLADTYFGHYQHDAKTNPQARNYDVFTADFNEDFTAFHGRTMLDQAEYLNEAVKFILSLYLNNHDPPQLVVIVGHSMGGVVARAMVTLPNYVPGSINTIVTLASPHAASPLTFDGDLIRLYSSIDRFWYDGYDESLNGSVAHARLANVSLISITGGMLDDTLPADYTTLAAMVPATNGFTAYTTGITEVWSPIDHLAIVWCDQLRHRLARALLDIVDVSAPQRTYSLDKRMSIFRQHLLSGFEDYATQDKLVHHYNHTFNVKRDDIDASTQFLVAEQHPGHHVTVFDVANNTDFVMLTSVPPTVWPEFVANHYINPSVLLCRATNTSRADYDVSTRRQPTVVQQCIDVLLDYNVVPNPHHPLKSSALGGETSPYFAIQYNLLALAEWDTVVVFDRLTPSDDDAVLQAQSYPSNPPHYTISGGLAALAWGQLITLPADRPMVLEVAVPGAWSLILAYNVIFRPKLRHGSLWLMVRQWGTEPYETKWHVDGDLSSLVITKHGIAPYTPFRVTEKTDHGVNFQIWQLLPLEALEVHVRVNWWVSLRLLVLRYRLALVAICVLILLAVMCCQIRVYQTTHRWPDFVQAMAYLVTPPVLIAVMVTLIILTPLTKVLWIQEALDLIDPVVLRDPNDINLLLRRDYRLNSFYLGLEESFLWFLGPMFFTIGVGLVYLLALVISLLGSGLRRGFRRVMPTPTEEPKPLAEVEIRLKLLPLVAALVWLRRRTIVMGTMIVLVPFYLPYLVVYVACVVIQALKVCRYAITELALNYHYQMTLLMVMLWTLPVNIPILVVFVHNIAVNWTTPFSSHHNLLLILPILIVTRLGSIPNFGKNTYTRVVVGYLAYCIGYCVVYGVRHTFWIHHLVNALCCLLIFGYIDPR